MNKWLYNNIISCCMVKRLLYNKYTKDEFYLIKFTFTWFSSHAVLHWTTIFILYGRIFIYWKSCYIMKKSLYNKYMSCYVVIKSLYDKSYNNIKLPGSFWNQVPNRYLLIHHYRLLSRCSSLNYHRPIILSNFYMFQKLLYHGKFVI